MGREDLLTGIGCDRTHRHKTKLLRFSAGVSWDASLRFDFIEAPETRGGARVRLLQPLFSGPQPYVGSFFGLCAAPQPEKKPVFDFRAHSCHSCAYGNSGFRLRPPG
jgi:hypothetical protein